MFHHSPFQEAFETGEGFEATRSNLAAHPFQNPWHQSSFTHMKVLADEAASIRTSPLLRWLLRSPPKAPIQQAPPPGASLITTPIGQAPRPAGADLKRRHDERHAFKSEEVSEVNLKGEF